MITQAELLRLQAHLEDASRAELAEIYQVLDSVPVEPSALATWAHVRSQIKVCLSLLELAEMVGLEAKTAVGAAEVADLRLSSDSLWRQAYGKALALVPYNACGACETCAGRCGRAKMGRALAILRRAEGPNEPRPE